MTKRFSFFCLFLFGGFFFVSIAQDYEVTVTIVTVWVKATDKSGKPVTGLTQDDFEILEDGKKVTLTCFEESMLSSEFRAQPGAESPTNDSTEIDPAGSSSSRKRVVLLIDLSNTSQAEYLHLKKRTDEFLEQLSEQWDVSVVVLISGLIEVEIESTSDAFEIQSALDQLQANMKRDMEAVQNRRLVADRVNSPAPQNPRSITEGCLLAREFAHQEKRESRLWLESLRQFDKYLGKQPQENHTVVLFLSGGISSNPGRQYFDVVRNSNLARKLVPEDWDFTREFPECDYETGSDLQKEFRKLVGKLNRYNITFYTINSRGPINDLLETVRERDRRIHSSDLQFLKEYQDFLVLMADDTGGIHFENSSNFQAGFDAILRDLDHQYLLCYRPPEHKKESHHSIQVTLKKPGIKLRYRSGYFD